MKSFVKSLNKEKHSQRLILVWLLFPMGFWGVDCQINLPLMSLQFYWMCLWVNHTSQRNQSDLCQWHGCFQKVWFLTLGRLSSWVPPYISLQEFLLTYCSLKFFEFTVLTPNLKHIRQRKEILPFFFLGLCCTLGLCKFWKLFSLTFWNAVKNQLKYTKYENPGGLELA